MSGVMWGHRDLGRCAINLNTYWYTYRLALMAGGYWWLRTVSFKKIALVTLTSASTYKDHGFTFKGSASWSRSLLQALLSVGMT